MRSMLTITKARAMKGRAGRGRWSRKPAVTARKAAKQTPSRVAA
jgi:hypothetical protein